MQFWETLTILNLKVTRPKGLLDPKVRDIYIAIKILFKKLRIKFKKSNSNKTFECDINSVFHTFIIIIHLSIKCFTIVSFHRHLLVDSMQCSFQMPTLVKSYREVFFHISWCVQQPYHWIGHEKLPQIDPPYICPLVPKL